MFKRSAHKILNSLVCALLVFQLTGCGTILHPERKGQRAGRLDAGIVLLDGIGLLFFLVPGVIAFAVDFNNGTIYLPGTFSGLQELKDARQVKFDPQDRRMETIAKIVQQETGCDVKLYQDDMEIFKLKSIDDMTLRFAEVLPDLHNTRLALLR